MNAREKLDELKDLWGLRTDEELANKLDTQKTNIDVWVRRKKIPEKWELKISQMTDIGNKRDLVSLNFYDDIYASAGYGAVNDDYQPTKMEFDRNFLEKVLGIKKFDRLDIIRVIGDSMLPSIRDGEYIIIENGADAKNGDTVIANIEGELYVKRLNKIPLSKFFTLESENTEYKPIVFDSIAKLELCSIIGVVRCKIKLF